MPPKRKAAPKAKVTANRSLPPQSEPLKKKARVEAKKAAPPKSPTPEPEADEDSAHDEVKDNLDSDDESGDGDEREDLPKDPQIRVRTSSFDFARSVAFGEPSTRRFDVSFTRTDLATYFSGTYEGHQAQTT